MLSKLQKFIYPILSAKTFNSDNELYLFLILYVATAFSMGIHIILLFIFGVLQQSILLIPNIFSISVYFVCFYFMKKKIYWIVGLIISIEVTIYTLLSVYVIGGDCNTIFYLYIVLIMQLSIPYATWKVRGAVIAVLWISIIATVLIGEFSVPIEQIGSIRLFLSILNIHVGFFGAITELLIGNVIKGVIDHFNVKKIEELKNQVYTDDLTGLYNRRYADAFFKRISDYPTHFGWFVAILDIDDFKLVNDNYGHAAGDLVLEKLAKIMKNNLRRTDVIIRWGGEEFLLFLEDVDSEDAFKLLEKLRKIIEETEINYKSKSIRFTVTAGAEKVDIQDVMSSIEAADGKLYVGKSKGKNIIIL